MSETAITVPVEQSPLARMAQKHGVTREALEQIMLTTIIKANASREEIAAFLIVCDRYGLDPIRKEVYPMKAHGGGLVPIVGVDGWATIVAADPRCDGFTFQEHREDGKLVAVTCTMRVRGRSLDTEVTEYLSECYRQTEPWKQMPSRMLRHKALIQAARIVFGINGIYDEDEGRDIATGVVGGRKAQEEAARKAVEDAATENRSHYANREEKEAGAARVQQVIEEAQAAKEQPYARIEPDVVEKVAKKGKFHRIRVVLKDGTELVSEDESHFAALDMGQQGIAIEALVVDGRILGVRDAS